MKKGTGQSLRLGGMLIEMLGVMGVMTGKGDIESLRLRLPGDTVVSPAWTAVVLGFVIWLVGTILVASSRTSRPKL
ncbi:MAG: hypothetical protein ACLQGP_22030 [Isosphaeraceae bacterium]